MNKAEHLDPEYTANWIENLQTARDLSGSYSRLVRDLPDEAKLTTPDQYAALRIGNLVELLGLREGFKTARGLLDHNKELRDAAFVKLGPVLEQAILSEPAMVSLSDLYWLLTVLTGYEPIF